MSYYEDLTPYAYLPGQPPMRNVGWLAEGHPFTVGEVPVDHLANLITAAAYPHNILRGVHDCEFCDEESPIRLAAPVSRGYVSLGMGELHVVGTDGITYSAPSLIIHYINRHGYRPPAKFIDAVLHGNPCARGCA